MPLLLQGRVTDVLLYVPLVCESLTKCTFALRQGFVLLGKNPVPLPTYPLGEKLSLGYSFAVYLPDFATSL